MIVHVCSIDRKPQSKMGYLKRRDDGATTLNILNPDNDGVVSEKERVVSMGDVIDLATELLAFYTR